MTLRRRELRKNWDILRENAGSRNVRRVGHQRRDRYSFCHLPSTYFLIRKAHKPVHKVYLRAITKKPKRILKASLVDESDDGDEGGGSGEETE